MIVDCGPPGHNVIISKIKQIISSRHFSPAETCWLVVVSPQSPAARTEPGIQLIKSPGSFWHIVLGRSVWPSENWLCSGESKFICRILLTITKKSDFRGNVKTCSVWWGKREKLRLNGNIKIVNKLKGLKYSYELKWLDSKLFNWLL